MGSATHQSVPTNTYLVDIGVPMQVGTAASIFWFGTIQVFEFSPPPNSPYQLLLGRDILCKGTLSFSFDGHFTFSF